MVVKIVVIKTNVSCAGIQYELGMVGQPIACLLLGRHKDSQNAVEFVNLQWWFWEYLSMRKFLGLFFLIGNERIWDKAL